MAKRVFGLEKEKKILKWKKISKEITNKSAQLFF